ncbi:MAG: hypothetical protein U5R06_01980 [candidate division KSB1 bacterium]|nr:hypothetical protein [candidate division KSB1 bacterium]
MNMINLWNRFKSLNSLQKRGIIYISIALLMMAGELILCSAPRTLVLMLWGGVLGIGILVFTGFRSRRK